MTAHDKTILVCVEGDTPLSERKKVMLPPFADDGYAVINHREELLDTSISLYPVASWRVVERLEVLVRNGDTPVIVPE